MKILRTALVLRFAALASASALLCLAIALPYLRDKYGPIQVWLYPWEGEFAVVPIDRPTSILMAPKVKPGVINIYVEGEFHGAAELKLNSPVRRLNSRMVVSLPEGLNQVHTFDWYEGPCLLEYVPGSTVSGKLTVKWKYG